MKKGKENKSSFFAQDLLKNTHCAHFVGIGGISMSALALILKKQNIFVSGSDIAQSVQTDDLQAHGVVVSIGHSASNIPPSCDLIVYTGAISQDNPEIVSGRKRGIKFCTREDLLAEVSRNYDSCIAVAGTHGKSTTTAMLGAIMRTAKLNPTIHNGAVMNDVHSNLVVGSDKFFVTEACEFRRSFLTLTPKIAVITNVDADHMDCYRDIDELKLTFAQFGKQSETLIVNADCENSREMCGLKKTMSFGIRSTTCDVRAINIKEYTRGKYEFMVATHNRALRKCRLSVVGYHNIYNALAAIAAAIMLDIDVRVAVVALESYTGISRRFEQVGRVGNCDIIIDYAHHPTELATTCRTARSLYKSFLVVFQPHTYTRTIALFDEFVKVLEKVPCVVFKTYAAREKPIIGGRAFDLARRLNVKYFANDASIKKFLSNVLPKYEAIIFAGAGDIDLIAKQEIVVKPDN